MGSRRRGVTETSGGPTRTNSAHAISAPRLEGRQPDVAAIRAVLATMPPPPNPKLVAAGAYDLKDREMALVQMAAADRLRGHAELAEVVDGQAEGGSGAVRGSPLRPRSHHPVRALVC